MKRLHLSLLVLPVSLFVLPAVAATVVNDLNDFLGNKTSNSQATSNNTVKFKGEVSDQTCVVDINGTKDTPVILLPTVAASDLSKANDVAGKTSFTVNLTGCTAALLKETKISSVFQGMNTTTSGNLGNTGSAKNVSIQLLDPNGKAVNLSNGMVKIPGIVLAANSTSASQDLSVQYITEAGGAAAGTVMASAQYAIAYP